MCEGNSNNNKSNNVRIGKKTRSANNTITSALSPISSNTTTARGSSSSLSGIGNVKSIGNINDAASITRSSYRHVMGRRYTKKKSVSLISKASLLFSRLTIKTTELLFVLLLIGSFALLFPLVIHVQNETKLRGNLMRLHTDPQELSVIAAMTIEDDEIKEKSMVALEETKKEALESKYGARAYECNDRMEELIEIEDRAKREVGTSIQICFEPNEEAREAGIRIERIDSWMWETHTFDGNPLQCESITDGKGDEQLSSVNCNQDGSNKCLFQSMLGVDFFMHNEPVLGKGKATLNKGTGTVTVTVNVNIFEGFSSPWKPSISVETERLNARRNISRNRYNKFHNIPQDRTVLFVHFHKAGGSSVVKKFQDDGGYQMWSINENGDPQQQGLGELMFWNYTRPQYQAFLADGNQQSNYYVEKHHLYNQESHSNEYNVSYASNRVEFIATEWNFLARDHFFEPQKQQGTISAATSETTTSWLRSTAKMDVITIMRDPYDRFISNFYFRLDNQEKNFEDPLTWSRRDFVRNKGQWSADPRPLHFFLRNNGRYTADSRPLRLDEQGKLIEVKIGTNEQYGVNMAHGAFFAVNYNKPNYYTAYLNGLCVNDNEEDIVADSWTPNNYDFDYFAFGMNQTHLEIAKEKLRTFFDVIIIMERPETQKLLAPWFEFLIDEKDTAAHEDPYYLLPHQNKNNKKAEKNEFPPLQFTREEFYKYNALDKELYEYAVELSLSKLKQIESRNELEAVLLETKIE